jgi:hypothetical protein
MVLVAVEKAQAAAAEAWAAAKAAAGAAAAGVWVKVLRRPGGLPVAPVAAAWAPAAVGATRQIEQEKPQNPPQEKPQNPPQESKRLVMPRRPLTQGWLLKHKRKRKHKLLPKLLRIKPRKKQKTRPWRASQRRRLPRIEQRQKQPQPQPLKPQDSL